MNANMLIFVGHDQNIANNEPGEHSLFGSIINSLWFHDNDKSTGDLQTLNKTVELPAENIPDAGYTYTISESYTNSIIFTPDYT